MSAAVPGDPDLAGAGARTARTRRRLAEAAVDMFEEGSPRFTVPGLAARVGLSERSVLRHVRDLDSFAHDAFSVVLERMEGYWVPPEPVGDRAARIAGILAVRSRRYRVSGPYLRAMWHYQPLSSAVAGIAALRRRVQRDQLRIHFAPELAVLPSEELALRVALIDMVASVDTLAHLDELGVDSAQSTRVVTLLLDAILPTPDDPGDLGSH